MQVNANYKVGILGGGQLGKMMALAAANWDLQIWSLDQDKSFPAGTASTRFVEGDFKKYDDVYQFGQQVDVLTIEIEHVNTAALLQLEKEGVKVHPRPAALEIIKDKGLQKQFYAEQDLPTAKFELYASGEAIKQAITDKKLRFPFVQKSRTAGYDGKGVAVIRSAADLDKILMTASIIEPLVDIKKELAVIAARNESGEVTIFPCVEMEFHPVANLVEFLVCPANISPYVEAQTEELATQIIEKFDVCGLLAVEFFLTNDDEVLVNEVAPRPHNSGHHTIDSCYTSQFQQHLRAVTNFPLGSTKMKTPSVMVNLLGAADYTGQAVYENLDRVMAMEGVNVHLYGKTTTKPYRKMGHATVVAESTERAREIARVVKDTLVIKA